MVSSQSQSLVYHIEGIFIVPLHELIHYITAWLLGVPAKLWTDSVTYEGSSWIKNMTITLAPCSFALMFISWAIVSYWFSPQSLSSIIILSLQLGYGILHLEMCKYDLQDAFDLLLGRSSDRVQGR
ncbi:MAG: hypothetical protein AAF902_05820 [Chloroflexota bacterium]